MKVWVGTQWPIMSLGCLHSCQLTQQSKETCQSKCRGPYRNSKTWLTLVCMLVGTSLTEKLS